MACTGRRSSAVQVLAVVAMTFSLMRGNPPFDCAISALQEQLARQSVNETGGGSSSCFVEKSFQARKKWLQNEGFIMLHHVRRAGGTTLCGILADDDNPIRDENCNLKTSPAIGSSYLQRYSLSRLSSVRELEDEMERQSTRVVGVEGNELPAWFLNDPKRSERWTIVTSIRHPVDRLISISRSKCKDKPYNCWNQKNESHYPLNNVMTRMFAGGMGNPDKKVTEEDFQRAVRNLETHYQIILITEWIPELTAILKYWLGIEKDGNLRRGHGGVHTKEALKLGKQNAVLHYSDNSSAKEFLKNDYPGLYEKMVEEHQYDFRLLHHFQAREKWRAANCFLFRTENLPH